MTKQWTVPELIDFLKNRCVGIDQSADALRWEIIKTRDAVEPTGDLATKLRELAESQTDLDPEARRVLYSRMRELYLR